MILHTAKEKFFHKLQKEDLLDRRISLRAKVLSTQEAIGSPEEYDFPLLKGREKIIEAEFEGHKGHAFTDMYGGYEGSLKEVLDLPLSNNYKRALLVATMNALVSYWGLVDDTVHCKDEQPRACAQKCVPFFAGKVSARQSYCPCRISAGVDRRAFQEICFENFGFGQRKRRYRAVRVPCPGRRGIPQGRGGMVGSCFSHGVDGC